MSYAEIREAVTEMATAFEAFKAANDERLDALEKGDDSKAAEIDETLKKINASITAGEKKKKDEEAEIEAMRERIEILEAKEKSPKLTPLKQIEEDHKRLFIKWIRAGGNDREAEQAMKKCESKAIDLQQRLKADGQYDDVKAGSVLTSVGAQGGVAVPEEISRMIEKLELKFSPIREDVKVVKTNTSDYKELVNIRQATSGWAGETTTRTQTEASNLREVTPTNGELFAYPWASDWALEDIFFDVEEWLAMEAADAFAQAEATAVVSGDGSNKLTGMLNTQPVLTDDQASPLRAATAYEYIAHDAATNLSPPSGTAQIVADTLIDMIYLLNSRYRMGAKWIMNSATTGGVRKLKDTQNQYLWAPGLQPGQPAMLLGYPVSTWEQMPDIGLNNFPIAFGNLKRAYLLTDRVGLRITRDDVTKVGYVKFFMRRREGGIVLNNDALKFGRTIG